MRQISPSHVADAISAGAIIGAFVNLLPPLGALAALIWYLVQLYESKTVQGWLQRRRRRKLYRRLKARRQHKKMPR